MKSLHLIALCIAVAALSSCQAISNLIHDDEVVARVGKQKLFLSELESYMPSGLMPEDSVSMAAQYIETWASEKLFYELASKQMSKSERDVSSELDAYKKSLLKYRYEQRYINERLDTTVHFSEVEEYYEAHKDMFVLDVPILKARFVDIMQDSPNLEAIKEKMSSDLYEDIVEADSLSYSSALKHADYSEEWISANILARDFETDFGTMLSHRSGKFIEMTEERGDVKIAYLVAIHGAGSVAPLDYCEERIRDIIISNRKRTLLSTLEQDLLDDARSKDRFVIYSSKK